jgi:hypothetical protein
MNQRIGVLGIGLLAALPWLGGCFGQGSSGSAGPTDDSGPPATFEAAFGDTTAPPSVTINAGSVIDFGLADCGGKAPAAQTFTVTNTGSSTVHYALSLSATSVFQIVGTASGDVAAGMNATATIATTAVAASATAGEIDQATLTITTDDPKLPMAEVSLKRTAQGATLTLSPATAAFGDIPVSATSQSTALTLTNTGNEAATVVIGGPTDPQFALAWTGTAGAPVSLAPKASVPMLGATFSPTAMGAASATSALTVTGAVCGMSVSSIPMTGNGTKGVVAVTPGTLDFKKVSCGQTAPPQTVTLTNSGTAALNFKAALVGGATSPFTVSPAAGPLAAGANVTITITPSAIPAVASVAANAFGDTLQITSDVVGDANHDVTLTETAQGAVLALDTTSIPFGDVTLLQTKTSPFNVTNTGTLPATVSLQATGAAFSVTPATPTTLTVGGAALAGKAAFAPTVLGSQGGSIAISTGATDVVCSAPIGPITLNGNGANGTLSLSTGALNFQSVPCKTAAAPQSFTLSNTGTASFAWSAALGKGAASPYQLSVSTGTLAPGAPATTVTVTPATIPFPSALTANLYGDTITITPTGVVGGAAQTIALSETAEGAVITVAPSPFPAFANQQEAQASAPATLTITNTGTMPVTLTPSIGGTNVSSFSLKTPGATALAINGGSYSPGPTITPQATGALAAQVNLAVGANDVLCQPLPAAVPLSGTGTNGSIALGAASITIAAQPCGATSGLTQTLKLTNNGTASLTWTAAVLGTTGFSVLPTTGSIAGGGAFTTITVTGPTFASTRGNVTAVTDTLRVTTTAFGDVAHNVTLSSTPSGAILAWGAGLTSLPFGTVQATTGGTKGKNLPLSLVNDGNASATVSFALAGTTPFTFSPQNTAVAGGGGVLSGNATFDPTSSSGQSDTVNMTVPAGTPLCAALPTGLPISGTGAQGTLTASAGLDFTVLECNTQAKAQTFTVNDTPGVVPYDFTASITAGWTVSPTSGTVTPGTPFTMTVTPPPTGIGKPASSDNAVVAITTDIPGDVVHYVTVAGTISGATFEFLNASGAAEPTLSWGSTVQGTGTDSTILEGTGNGAASVSVVVTAGSANLAGAQLLINGKPTTGWTGTAGIANSIVYSLSAPANCPCGAIFTYTVTVPSTLPGVCGGTTQTLTILEGNSC